MARKKEGRGKKVMVTLPEGIYRGLEKLSGLEGSNPTSLSNTVVAQYVREAIQNGILQIGDLEEPASDRSAQEALDLLIGFLNSLIDTGTHNGYSLAEIAEILGRSSDKELIALVEKLQNGDGKPQP